jgi:hypothetical protein
MRQRFIIGFNWMSAGMAVCWALASQARAVTLDDVDFWVGTGTNKAAFVLDWADGRAPLLWGYQWNGVATAKQMFHDIVAADARLFAKTSDQFGFGEFISGIGYDRDGDGFALSDGTVFDAGGLFQGPAGDTATALDADDSYAEGLFSAGFWAYYIADGNPYLGDTWDEAQAGISDTMLTPGGFQGIRFAPGFDSAAPTTQPTPAQPGAAAAVVPEPGMLVMLVIGAAGIAVRRRRGES